MDIEKIIKIQKLYKRNKNIINNINSQLNRTYNFINGIMIRINNNFILDIKNQYDYNYEMNLLDNQLLLFRNIPRPFVLKDKLYYNTTNILKKIKSINHNLFIIIKKSGCSNIFDSLELTLNNSIKNILNTFTKKNKNSLYFYNRVFIPLEIITYDYNELNTTNKELIIYKNNNVTTKSNDLLNINNNNNIIFCCKNIKKKKSFIEKLSGGRLYINLTNIEKYIIIEGYFLDDPLNMCRIGGYLGDKINNLEKKIKILNINNSFKKAFIQQISIRDFIINSIEDLIEQCSKAYKELINLKNKTISSLVKDFLIADISKQRDILTLFLLKKDDIDTQYLAYLMYDMITNESYLLKPQPLAEKVFNSLHWSVQKLFKTAIKKINKTNTKLLNFNEEEIPYEKRIFLMKANDIVKSKALDKYKEYTKSGENSSKCLQYLDGILKIPFGIYKKEHILCFLDNYREDIINFINKFINECKKVELNNNIKGNLNLCLEYKKYKLTSQQIDNFINNFNYNMFYNLDDKLDTILIKNKIIKLKKGKIIEIIKLINEEYEKIKEPKIKIKKKKEELIIDIVNFIINPKYFELSQKYINYLNIDRKIKNNNKSCSVSNLNNNFFNLNSLWFNYKNDYKKYLFNIDKILDKAVYHQEEAKLQIKRVIAQWINGEMKGYCFGFEGPPGTGKTSLAKKGISHCLIDNKGNKRPFIFIALGGSSNGSTLEGHSYTYVGSIWGRIVDILMETKCMNPIIYIDELDKVSKTENGKEIIGILTHLTDSTQNDEFYDKYFSGIKIDLSKVLFIFSYNDYSLLDPILADRIHRVKFHKLNKNEKIHIINNYILPELLNTIGFNTKDIIFPKKIIEYIINNYTQEAGVRKIKEKIFEIVREINLKYLMNSEDYSFPITITITLIDNIFHNKPKISFKKIALKPQIGLVNGLYATNSGLGGLTMIESFKTPSDSKLSLELTGQQGDVMKESMKVSKTVAWNLLPDEIKKNIYNEMKNNGNFGIHLHCPEGATPKDGPSAGGAITLSIISLLTNIKVSNEIALTGEIDLNGTIHEIGGLESKIEGGKKAGVKKILYPIKNNKDLKIILEKDPSLKKNIELIPISNIWEVIDLCLIDNNIKFLKYN